MNSPSVLVIQMGARRNYIYAEQLERAGMLHSLVTDMAWSQHGSLGLGSLIARLSPHLRAAIARRTVRHIPAAKLRSSILPNLAHAALWWQAPENRGVAADEALAVMCRMRGLRGADVIVNYLGNGGTFLHHAKRAGAKIATDFICMPSLLEIEELERQRWPAWGGQAVSPTVIRNFRQRMHDLLALSDIYLCPSKAVANDLAQLPEFDATKVRFMPYGAGGLASIPAATVHGRVLFAGAGLPRKGLPYLGLAAAQLAQGTVGVEVHVAGETADLVRRQPETRCLRFLGILDRDRMASAFSQADVFCLPSLTEGSSSAIFEALAFGVPVVTTASSGSVVTDGVDGFIVPERNSEAIASAIQRIVENRGLRQRMSESARATAARYSDMACGAEFIRVIRDLQER